MQPAAAEVKWHILNLSDISDDVVFSLFFFLAGIKQYLFSMRAPHICLFDILLMTDEQNRLDKQTQIEYNAHAHTFLRCVPHLSGVLTDFFIVQKLIGFYRLFYSVILF